MDINITNPVQALNVGDSVCFSGNVHYTNSNAATGRACQPGPAKITVAAPGAKHHFHLIAEKGGGSTVYGWVDAVFIQPATPSPDPTLPIPEPVTPPSPVGDVITLAVKHAAQIIYANEGIYGSVNKNDNGAVSIGKVQWHAGRALSLMKTICSKNTEQAKHLLGSALYTEITTAVSSAWKTRVANAAEAGAISKLLVTADGKAAQDALALADITVYAKKGQSYGLKDCGAIIYFCDGVNQYGTGAKLWRDISALALQTTGDVEAMLAATKKLTTKYLPRRERVYRAVLALKLGEEKRS